MEWMKEKKERKKSIQEERRTKQALSNFYTTQFNL